MTIQQIVDEIVAEIGGDTYDEAVSAKIFGFLKSAMRRMPKRVRERTFIKISTVTLTAGADTASTPTDFVRELAVYYKETSQAIPITRMDTQRFLNRHSLTAQGNPEFYRIYGKTMEFDKAAAVTTTIYVEHFFTVSNSLALTDTFAGNDDIVEAVKDLTKGMYFMDYEEDSAKGQAKIVMAMDELQKIDDEFIEEELGGHVEEAE